jgi:hypothetical protein
MLQRKIFSSKEKILRALIPLTAPKPHVLKKLSEAVFSKIFPNFSPVSDSITVRENLLLFQHEHRSRDGYIDSRNAEAGIDKAGNDYA